MRMTTTETGGESWWFWCQGCETHHYFRTKKGPTEVGSVWEKVPNELTFKPSLLMRVRDPISGKMTVQCHLFLRKGMVKFLGDCAHDFKGKTVPVEDAEF